MLLSYFTEGRNYVTGKEYGRNEENSSSGGGNKKQMKIQTKENEKCEMRKEKRKWEEIIP